MTNRLLFSMLLGSVLWVSSPALADQEEVIMIEAGRTVSLEYTLKLDDGNVVDTNVGGQPLVFEQGKGEILPALESSLMGLKAEDRKNVTLSPEEGYGTVNPEAFRPVPIDVVPDEAREVGAQLVLQSQDGRQFPALVHEVGAQDIVLNLNHPLAGETLHFDVRVLEVN